MYYTILNRTDIIKFTYSDKKENYIIDLHEESTNYKTLNKKVNNQHDKIFRKILSKEKEAVVIINSAINVKPEIRPEEIEEYKSSFVTDLLENREADIIYKLKSKNWSRKSKWNDKFIERGW